MTTGTHRKPSIASFPNNPPSRCSFGTYPASETRGSQETNQEGDVPLIFSNTKGVRGGFSPSADIDSINVESFNLNLGHITENEAKELDDVASQLRKASKMHAGQAKRISDLGMTTSTSTTTSSSHLPSLRDDTAGEPSMPIPAGSGLFGAKKRFSQVGGSARRRLGSVAREPSPVYGAHIDTQLSLSSSQKNSLMTEQHSDILGFSGLSAGQSGHWFE